MSRLPNDENVAFASLDPYWGHRHLSCDKGIVTIQMPSILGQPLL